ncbi:hypothetical protein D9615_004309 [Tricholomella constricta]|uniref:Histone acetyltransferase n=1 Tax=Tricholomella constricta TaxID=117010 RepID=A0A8H5M659_9AGAR|nr:hypothetical protein D9615_004309 [Tricholomella constricta]
MRGLAFPVNAAFDRETSYEYGTPVTNPDDIPIDPALAGPVIDPALMGEGMDMVDQTAPPEVQFPPHTIPPHPFPPPAQFNQVQQYSDGPQGDPFAPQPLPMYFPVEVEPPISPPKPVKRKRKPARERECGFCQGNDRKNKAGQPELMATCDECGRSGHPSCMELPGLGDILRSYAWNCMECKTCEICNEKGDDDRILFCDFCDRGWHMDCMQPPIQEAPKGRWHCPKCPPLPPDEVSYDIRNIPLHEQLPATPTIRESSVASSSRSHPTKRQLKGKGKGKEKAKAPMLEDSDSEVDVDVEATPKAPRGRGRPKKVKSKAPQYSDDDLPPSSSPRQHKRVRVQHSPVSHAIPRIRLRLATQKGKGKEREEEEPPKGLFDDILTEEERDTFKTSISAADKQRFERSRMIAEEQQAPLPPPPRTQESEGPDLLSTPGPSSRPLRSSALHISTVPTSTPLGASASPAPSTATPGPFFNDDPTALRIRSIRFGQFDIKTWYDAPFPEEYATIPDGRLWICEFCLKYMKSRFACERHRLKCKSRHPPGDEIYRDGTVSVFEVDGRKNKVQKIYCQNLCLLSKMFLDHKSLFYDVEPFLFYVMTEMDDFGARFVGYFSKEKQSPKDYNVSCIMTLPVRQRQGWGNLLIDFSYLLSKKEQRAGSPEKPLSGLGALGYKNYWTLSLMRYFETAPDRPRLEEISLATSMTLEDIVVTLTQQGMISAREPTPPPIKPLPGQSIKIQKGRKNGVARRHLQRTQTNDKESESPKGPFVAPTHYEITWNQDRVEQYLQLWEAKGYLKLKPEKLQWSPYILTRKDKAEKEREKEKRLAEEKERETISAPAAGSSIKSDESSRHSNTEPATPNAALPSPMNIFDDDLVEEVPRPLVSGKQKSRSKSPAAMDDIVTEQPEARPLPRKQPSRSRSKQDTSKANLIEEPRSTRGGWRTGDLAKIETAKSHPVDQTPGRALRSKPSEPNKRAAPTLPTPKARKRKRVEPSSDMELEQGDNGADKAKESPPPQPVSALPNGKHINGEVTHTIEAKDLGVMLFEDEAVPLVLPILSSVIQEGRRKGPTEVGEHIVKSEDLGTPLTNLTSRQSLPSDDTVFITGAPNDKGLPVIEVDEGDTDADGEYEEDAEGEPDEEGALLNGN